MPKKIRKYQKHRRLIAANLPRSSTSITNALLNKNNIKSTEDHYNAMILNRALSESLHKEMMEGIKNDPKLADLAAKMGK